MKKITLLFSGLIFLTFLGSCEKESNENFEEDINDLGISVQAYTSVEIPDITQEIAIISKKNLSSLTSKDTGNPY